MDTQSLYPFHSRTLYSVEPNTKYTNTMDSHTINTRAITPNNAFIPRVTQLARIAWRWPGWIHR